MSHFLNVSMLSIVGSVFASAAFSGNCVSPEFLRKYDDSTRNENIVFLNDGDVEISVGAGEGVYKMKFIRPDFSLVAFHAGSRDKKDGLYIGEMYYDPSLLTGDKREDFIFGGTFVSAVNNGEISVICLDPSNIDRTIVETTLKVLIGTGRE